MAAKACMGMRMKLEETVEIDGRRLNPYAKAWPCPPCAVAFDADIDGGRHAIPFHLVYLAVARPDPLACLRLDDVYHGPAAADDDPEDSRVEGPNPHIITTAAVANGYERWISRHNRATLCLLVSNSGGDDCQRGAHNQYQSGDH